MDMREMVGLSKLGPADEERIRAIVREEIAAYFASVSTSDAGPQFTVNVAPDTDPEALLRKVEAAMVARYRRGDSYPEYLATRDEPPAAPPLHRIIPTQHTEQPL